MLGVLRNPAFARLFAAGATSTAGRGIGQLALTWLVFIATGSALDIAGVNIATLVAAVALSLFAGALVDRHDRRRLMLAADIARAATLAFLTLSLVLLGFNLILVFSAAFIVGAGSMIFDPAERALTPAIVGPTRIADANGLVQASNSVLSFVSNGLAGVLIALAGVVLSLGFNALTFGISAVLIGSLVIPRSVSTPRRALEPGGRTSLMSDLREGVRYLVGQRGLLALTASAGLENFFSAIVLTFLVLYTTQLLHSGAVVFGLLEGLLALGWAPGALLVRSTHAVRRAGLVWILAGIAEGSLILVLVAAPVVPLACAVVFAAGLLFGYSNTTWLTAVQLIVPTEMQGRYFGLDQLGSWAIIPVGQLAGGLLIGVIGVPLTFTVAGVGFLATSLCFLASADLRRLRAPDADGGNAPLPSS